MSDFTFSQLKYERPDYDMVEKECKKMVEDIKNAKSYGDIKDVLERRERLYSTIATMSTIAYIRNTLDTTDEFYEKEVEFINEREAEAEIAMTEVSKALLECGFTEDIAADFGPEFLVIEKREVDKFREELVPYKQKEAKLTMRYQKM